MAVSPPETHAHPFYSKIAKRYNMSGVWYLDLWPIGPVQVVVTDAEGLNSSCIFAGNNRKSSGFLFTIINRNPQLNHSEEAV